MTPWYRDAYQDIHSSMNSLEASLTLGFEHCSIPYAFASCFVGGKNRLYTFGPLKIWVVTPINEGFGFSWYPSQGFPIKSAQNIATKPPRSPQMVGFCLGIPQSSKLSALGIVVYLWTPPKYGL